MAVIFTGISVEDDGTRWSRAEIERLAKAAGYEVAKMPRSETDTIVVPQNVGRFTAKHSRAMIIGCAIWTPSQFVRDCRRRIAEATRTGRLQTGGIVPGTGRTATEVQSARSRRLNPPPKATPADTFGYTPSRLEPKQENRDPTRQGKRCLDFS